MLLRFFPFSVFLWHLDICFVITSVLHDMAWKHCYHNKGGNSQSTANRTPYTPRTRSA